MLLPLTGFFPQISHICAIALPWVEVKCASIYGILSFCANSTVVRFYKAVLLDQNDVPRDCGIADLLLQMLAILVVYAGLGDI
jgi:hypothetical protein